MASSTTKARACSECHKAKVKCIMEAGSTICKRCERIGLKCAPHVSRQGQGLRRRTRKKTKNDNGYNDSTLDEAQAITSTLSSSHTAGGVVPCCPLSNGTNFAVTSNGTGKEGIHICRDMASLHIGQSVEDNIMCQSITGLDKNHYGIHALIRSWVALAFCRRSFSLLARASFIAAKMNISMDDIISNESTFAASSDSQPMDFLARDLLLSKHQRKTIGFPLNIQEIPWDLLETVHIDPLRLDDSLRSRCFTIRSTSQGISRFFVSPIFSKDYASDGELNKLYSENKPGNEIVDLFLPGTEKNKFSQDVFNHVFLHNKPDMPCFVTKTVYNVRKRNSDQLTPANMIMTIKLIDLDTFIQYIEIQYLNNNFQHESLESNINKRNINEVTTDSSNKTWDPIMDDGIEFTDLVVTEEMQEFFQLLAGDQKVQDTENNIF